MSTKGGRRNPNATTLQVIIAIIAILVGGRRNPNVTLPPSSFLLSS
jgi:hypothetical protein